MGMNKIIGLVNNFKGTSMRMTLGKKQIVQMAKNKVSDGFAQTVEKGLGRLKDPKLDVAYKASERGYTVGAYPLRDGKKIVSRGAASITNLGSETPIIKMRLSAGKNGDAFQANEFVDFAHTPRIQDVNMNLSIKNGVIESTSGCGRYGASHLKADIPKLTKELGLEAEGIKLAETFNNQVFAEGIQLWRGFLSGKTNLFGSPIEKVKTVDAGLFKKVAAAKEEELAKALAEAKARKPQYSMQVIPGEVNGKKDAYESYKVFKKHGLV